MKIKTLELIAFGKFKDRKIHLADRLNLVYGLNEAGKTTVQHFIEGMFFGFLKPYRKKKIYSDYYDRYKPLKDSRYCGAMTYEDENGREIRLERNFLKSDESLRIYDGFTGEDISDHYPFDPVSRQPCPLGAKINAAFYNNTVNLKERGHFSREVMLKEINDRLISKGGEADEDVSIYRVMTRLENKRNEIGTDKQKNSNYGEAVTHLHRLEREKEDNEKNREIAKANLLEIREMEGKLSELNEAYLALAPIYEKGDSEKRNQLIQRIESLNEENKDLQLKIKHLAGYRELTNQELSKLSYLKQSADNLRNRIGQQEKDILAADKDLLKEAEQEREITKAAGFFSKAEVQADMEYWQKSEKKARENNQLPFSSRSQESPRGGSEEGPRLQAPNNQRIKVYVLAVCLMILGFSLLSFGFVKGNEFFSFVQLLLLTFVAWFSLLSGVALPVLNHKYAGRFTKNRSVEEEPVVELVRVRQDMEKSDSFIEGLPEEEGESSLAYLKEDLSRKYGIRENKNVEDHLQTLLDAFCDLDQSRIRLQFIQEKKEKAQSLKDSLEAEQSAFETKMTDILKFRGLESVEAYRRALQKKTQLRRFENRLDYNRRLHKELEEMLASIRSTFSEGSRETTIKRVELREQIEELSRKIGELTYKSDHFLEKMRPGHELEEELLTYRTMVEEYGENYEAYTLAIDILKECATIEKDKLLPALAEEIGKIFSEISGMQTTVKVDQNLNIRVIRKEDDSYVPIESLSSGTVEQLYFAMRFGVQSMIHGKLNLPFILDDAFVQYDNRRKEMALRFLSEVSGQKQVIVFTCNDSEKQILDRLDLPYYGLVL